MKICNLKHDEIIYHGDNCPLCSAINEANAMISYKSKMKHKQTILFIISLLGGVLCPPAAYNMIATQNIPLAGCLLSCSILMIAIPITIIKASKDNCESVTKYYEYLVLNNDRIPSTVWTYAEYKIGEVIGVDDVVVRLLRKI